jgi:protein TonB
MAAGEPPPAVMIELAPVAVAPEAPSQDVAPGPQMTEAQPEPTLDTPERTEEKAEDQPEPKVAEVKQPVEQVSPLPAPQPQVEVPKLPERQEAEAVLTPPPPQPKAEQKRPPKVKRVEKKKPIDPKKTRAPHTTAPPTSQAQRANTAAAPSASNSDTLSVAPASWRGALNAHLNRYKRFPAGAAIGGIVQIAFTIDSSGNVLSSRLVRSSGDSALDQEAASLPRRASPVPAPPPNVGGGSITLTVPVRFNR